MSWNVHCRPSPDPDAERAVGLEYPAIASGMRKEWPRMIHTCQNMIGHQGS
jgi:hypothetical protein